MKKTLLLYLDNKIKILREGSGLSIVIMPIVKMNWEKLEENAKNKKIKLYYIHSDSTATFQAICMGFGGFLDEEIPIVIKVFSEVFLQAIDE